MHQTMSHPSYEGCGLKYEKYPACKVATNVILRMKDVD